MRLTCLGCRGPVKKKPAGTAGRQSRYCSTVCMKKTQGQRKRNTNINNSRSMLLCDECGQMFKQPYNSDTTSCRQCRTCKEPGCDEPYFSNGYCRQDGYKLAKLKQGKKERSCRVCGQKFISGEEHPTGVVCPSCKKARKEERKAKYTIGDKVLAGDGYVMVYVGVSQMKAEHTLVLEHKLGRALVKGHETAHHMNGIRNDNRPENLELWVGGIRYGQRAKDVTCAHCKMPYLVDLITDQCAEHDVCDHIKPHAL